MSSVSHVSEVYAISNFTIDVSRVGDTLVFSTLIMEAADSIETEQSGLAVIL
jgi:hypothetical protein